jgi:hypothetical protein
VKTFCDIEILDKECNPISQIDKCYFQYTYQWITGGPTKVRIMPLLKDITIMDEYGIPVPLSIDLTQYCFNLLDQYYIDGENKVSILNGIRDKYVTATSILGYAPSYPLPIEKVYLD